MLASNWTFLLGSTSMHKGFIISRYWTCKFTLTVIKKMWARGKKSVSNLLHTEVSVSNHAILAQFCKDHHVGLVVVGPEVPLSAGRIAFIFIVTVVAIAYGPFALLFTSNIFSGIVDDLTAAGVPCFGPSGKAAQLEASKSFSKAFMERHGIPTARYGSFTDPEEACKYIRTSVI